MSRIAISNLTTADNNSLVSTDSFFVELQATDTAQIFGGKHHGGYSDGGDDDDNCDDDHGNGHGKGHGNGHGKGHGKGHGH